MLNTLKQSRAAISLLNPEEVRKRAHKPVLFGLVATGSSGYAEMESFLSAAAPSRNGNVYRADQAGVPGTVDLVLFEEGIPAPKGAYTFHREHPESTVAEILNGNEDLSLALASQFPVFRKAVVEQVIHAVALENALFSIATALPDVIPSLVELPWALGEFASDTMFLTVNQVRMAFLIAAACGKGIGVSHQMAPILSIGASAFGWRALARELAGKIPLGGGLIPKGAIAYAGTYAVGKGLEHFYHANVAYTREERERVYQAAFDRGKAVAEKAVRP